jgi:hypothetical protein
MAGMELLAATAREVMDTAADSRAFSQENFIKVPPISFSPDQEGEDLFLVTVVSRRKKCGKMRESLGRVGERRQQGVWTGEGGFPQALCLSTFLHRQSTFFCGELV